tara:strand:- start:1256 stop:2842 length:1587 start_codon:yes stop_codon:yes gene_type:complete
MFFTNTRAASTARATRRSGTFTKRKKRKKIINKRFIDLLESGTSDYGPGFRLEQFERMLTPSDNSFNFKIENKGGAPLTWSIPESVQAMFPMLTFSALSGTLSSYGHFDIVSITTSLTETMEGSHSFYLPIDTNAVTGLAPRPSLATMFSGFTYDPIPDPPAHPDAVHYTTTNLREDTVTLSWHSKSGGAEDGFKVYKNTVDNFSTATLEETVGTGVISTQLIGLTPDTDYFFWIGVIETGTGTVFHDTTSGTFTTAASLPDPAQTYSDTGYYLDHEWLTSDPPWFFVKADGKKNQIAPSFWTKVKFDKEIMAVDNFKIDTKNSVITTYVTRTSPANHSKGCILEYLVTLGAKEDTGYLLFMNLVADPGNSIFDLKIDTNKNQPPLLTGDLLVIESESMSITNIATISSSIIRITVTRTSPQVHNPPGGGLTIFRQSAPKEDLGLTLESNLDTSSLITFRLLIDPAKPLIALKGLTTIWIGSEEMTIVGVKEKPGVWIDVTAQRANPVPHLANAIVFKDRDPIPHTKP